MAARVEEAKLLRFGGGDRKPLEVLVDGFQFKREGVRHYVLTHFHSDHTVGLTRGFDLGTIYCTVETGALIIELFGVEPSRVRGLRLGEAHEIDGACRLTMLDAHHCPGSAVVAFEELGSSRLVLHTGDCRACEKMRAGVQQWLDGRRVDELYLDTTYCDKRWDFPSQDVACEWLAEITRTELAREPKTLFIVGSYQIGKEQAVRAVAEAADSPAFVEHRRWRVLQLAGWGEVKLSSGKPLWSIDKEGCQVYMAGLGALGHEALKHFLDSSKGQFAAVVAFRPTGWAWSRASMSAKGAGGCRVWAENEGSTRIYGVPYSEHSSYLELQALAKELRPPRVVPTVNSETRAGKERMMSHFLDVVDLRKDPERMDHYLQKGGSSSSSTSAPSFVDVFALAMEDAGCRSQLTGDDFFEPAPTQQDAVAGGSADVADSARRKQVPTPCRWGVGMLRGGSALAEDGKAFAEGSEVLELLDSSSSGGEEGLCDEQPVASPTSGGATAVAAAVGAPGDNEDLRCVDVEQQRRLLKFFEDQRRRMEPAAPERGKAGSGKPGRSRPWPNKAAKATKGATEAPRAALLTSLGAQTQAAEASAAAPSKSSKRRRGGGGSSQGPEKKKQQRQPQGGGTPKSQRGRATGGAGNAADPKSPQEKRPTRFVPKPSARVLERIDRAFSHRLYLLAQERLSTSTDAAAGGVQLDVLGSTGNVYQVKLTPGGNECTCLDFAKGSGVCKHVLFVALRVLKLPREDYRVWQTSFTASELQELQERLAAEPSASGVQADAAVLRGYQQAKGLVKEAARRALPADCPICYEELSAAGADVDYCRTCGHNVHTDCLRRWAAACKQSSACPVCRSPWLTAAELQQRASCVEEEQASSSQNGPLLNLAAYSAEHQQQSLAELYPETHQWINRREARS